MREEQINDVRERLFEETGCKVMYSDRIEMLEEPACGFIFVKENNPIVIAVECEIDGIDEGVEIIVQRVLEQRKQKPLSMISSQEVMNDRQWILSHIRRCICTDTNTDFLDSVPHKKFYDLITFYVAVIEDGMDQEQQAAFTIYNSTAEKFGFTVAELEEAAVKNLEAEKYVTMSIYNILTSLNPDEYDVGELIKDLGSFPVYVITNGMRHNGGNAILVDFIFESLAQSLKDDLYVVLASKHEVLAMPVANMSEDAFTQLISASRIAGVFGFNLQKNYLFRFSRKEKCLKKIGQIEI